MSTLNAKTERSARRLEPTGKAALAKGVSEELYDRVVNPLALTRGGSADVPTNGKGV